MLALFILFLGFTKAATEYRILTEDSIKYVYLLEVEKCYYFSDQFKFVLSTLDEHMHEGPYFGEYPMFIKAPSAGDYIIYEDEACTDVFKTANDNYHLTSLKLYKYTLTDNSIETWLDSIVNTYNLNTKITYPCSSSSGLVMYTRFSESPRTISIGGVTSFSAEIYNEGYTMWRDGYSTYGNEGQCMSNGYKFEKIELGSCGTKFSFGDECVSSCPSGTETIMVNCNGGICDVKECKCISGYAYNGRCVSTCPSGTKPSSGKCSCESPYVSINGECKCQNYIFDGDCVSYCPGDTKANSWNECVCDSGYTLSGTECICEKNFYGTCVSYCPSHSTLIYDECICDDNYGNYGNKCLCAGLNFYGECVGSCPLQSYESNNNCYCNSGYTYSYGFCKKDDTEEPEEPEDPYEPEEPSNPDATCPRTCSNDVGNFGYIKVLEEDNAYLIGKIGKCLYVNEGYAPYFGGRYGEMKISQKGSSYEVSIYGDENGCFPIEKFFDSSSQYEIYSSSKDFPYHIAYLILGCNGDENSKPMILVDYFNKIPYYDNYAQISVNGNNVVLKVETGYMTKKREVSSGTCLTDDDLRLYAGEFEEEEENGNTGGNTDGNNSGNTGGNNNGNTNGNSNGKNEKSGTTSIFMMILVFILLLL